MEPGGQPVGIELTIADRSGEMHVLLDPGGDHIVTKFIVSPKGDQFETTLPYDSWAWERAVDRAYRGAALCENTR
jgi:hypothetical protein